MGYSQCRDDEILFFADRDDVYRYLEATKSENTEPGISYGNGARLVFHQERFSIARACAAAEISQKTLHGWTLAGFRTLFDANLLPRSEAVARMCVVRDLVSHGVAPVPAFLIAEDVADTILLYALQSSPCLTIFTGLQSEVSRRRRRDRLPPDVCASAFLGQPLGRFAKVCHSGHASFSDVSTDEDHLNHTVIDLQDIATRLANRSGPLASMTVFRTAAVDTDETAYQVTTAQRD